MKVLGEAFLLRDPSADECLRYALNLPIHCAALGRSTPGQLDDDLRIAQNFKSYTAAEMDEITAGPGGRPGSALEYWKIGGV